MFQLDLLSALGKGQRVRRGHSRRSATELQMTMGDWSWRNGEGGEYLQIVYMLLFLECSARVGSLGKTMNWDGGG